MRIRFACTLALATAAALPAVSSVRAATTCTPPGYSYAGLIGTQGLHGIAGTLSAVELPQVQDGHVAAWIGVGGRNEGPNGTDEWLQVGLNSGRGTGNTLYYEYARPGSPIAYVQVASGLPAGRPVPVMVLEMAGRTDTWRVWVGGKPVGEPIVLPRSHGRLTALATAENWDGGVGACNRYSYRFDGLRVAHASGGVWRPFTKATVRQDGGQIARTASSFVAVGGAAERAPATATAVPTPAPAPKQPFDGGAG